jgi:3-deoxy-D-manno-octulosonic-acid transferase
VVLYPPLDFAWVCRRFLRRWKPKVVVILETELWPNLIREVKRSGAALLLASGRLSDRSAPRYRATRFFWRRVLAYPDAFFVQSDRDAGRFLSIGAPASKIHVAGNLKFAMHGPASPLTDALSTAIERAAVGPVLIAGSTMPGEETHLLQALRELREEFPALWTILAPRHPERCVGVAAEVESAGFSCQFRSQWHPGTSLAPGIFLLDSAGELADLYRLGTAAFVGGTLVPTGGHNIIEPAQFGCPIVIGPSMHNFRETAEHFIQAEALIQVKDADGLARALRELFRDPKTAKRFGEAAHSALESHGSGLREILDGLENVLRGNAGKPFPERLASPTAAASAAR